mmetsp:Transcript_30136/g.76799  ORF Transcript_30136/g.76799 Transcript_30136/m.76799 type:complete len:129 (-) Transcript_30136:128-514(-)
MGALQPASSAAASITASTSSSKGPAYVENAFGTLQPAPPAKPPAPRTLYTDTYQQELELKRKLKQQGRQRAFAFWASFLTVTGTFLIRQARKAVAKRASAARRKAARAAKDQTPETASIASVPSSRKL